MSEYVNGQQIPKNRQFHTAAAAAAVLFWTPDCRGIHIHTYSMHTHDMNGDQQVAHNQHIHSATKSGLNKPHLAQFVCTHACMAWVSYTVVESPLNNIILGVPVLNTYYIPVKHKHKHYPKGIRIYEYRSVNSSISGIKQCSGFS